jgi:hypothetical protein
MASIFKDPRVHTGAGYYQIGDRNVKKRKLDDEEAPDEEDALRQQLQSLSEMSAEIKAQEQLVTDALQTFEVKRELQRREAELEKETQHTLLHIKQERNEASKLVQIETKRIQRRGTGWNANFKNIDKSLVIDDMLTDNVSCVALSGTGILIIYDDGRTSSIGIPRKFYDKLYGRQKSISKPVYAALGSNDTYYVRYADSSSNWNGINDSGFDSYVKNNHGVDKIAFSTDSGWFVSTKRGGFLLSGSFGNLGLILKSPSIRNRTIENISIGLREAYFVSFTDGHYIVGSPKDQHSKFNKFGDRMNTIGMDKIRHVYFSASTNDSLIRYQK